jgi:hypothetical protein
VTGNPKLKLKSLSIVFGWFLIFLWAFCWKLFLEIF